MPHTIQVGTYGLTEAAGTVSTSRLDDSFDVRTGRCGFPLEDWEMRIVDAETGAACGAGERGEIVLRGPNMLKVRGGMIAHIDATVVCEAPKVGPHRAAMRQRLAELLDAPLSSVSVNTLTPTTRAGAGLDERGL